MKTVDAHLLANKVKTDIAHLFEVGEDGVRLSSGRDDSHRNVLITVKSAFPGTGKRKRKVMLGKVMYNDGSKGNAYLVCVGIDVNAAMLIAKNAVNLFKGGK